MTLACTCAIACYLVFLATLFVGWLRRPEMPMVTGRRVTISVIVPVRNEVGNITNLISSILRQRYSDFEIIVIDDHSDDGTSEMLARFGSKIKLIKNDGVGKKSAITTGINHSSADVIVTTDGDCTFDDDWLQSIAAVFNDDTQMLIGAVRFENKKNFFTRLQQIELSSVIGSGIALTNLRQPALCNGANLAYRRAAFLAVDGYDGNMDVPSGDDEFLMRKIIDRYGKKSVCAMPVHHTLVTTLPPEGLNNFLSQRMRWTSKWRFNASWFSRLLAVLILMFQAMWIALLFILPVHPAQALLLAALTKVVFEAILLKSYCVGLRMRFSLLAFLTLQVLYPVYVLYVGIGGQLTAYQWKGRNYRR